jgi:double-stranded uracil-DNA glycosylase
MVDRLVRSVPERKCAPAISVLPDLLALHLEIVFCGTAVSRVSARRAAYYAGPGNSFWPTLHKVGLTPHRFLPEEYRGLLELRMGLTDLVKSTSGNDCDLSRDRFDRNRLAAMISHYRPRILAFTGKRAAEEFVGHPVDYGVLPQRQDDSLLVVLPSPSGAARRYWSEQPWQELSRLRHRTFSMRSGPATRPVVID